MSLRDLVARAKEARREKGILYIVAAAARVIYWELEFFVAKRGTFEFNGRRYRYLHRRPNRTWTNERCVEIPIIWKIVCEEPGRILEVGNVLSRYFSCRHDILDKYEKGKGVINFDVVDFKPPSRYDLIISISTLEHVGFDPPEGRDSDKIRQAIENLRKNCLAQSGRIVVTLPLGYNLVFDRMLYEGRLGFTDVFYMKRTARNSWVQTDARHVTDAKYRFMLCTANALVIGEIAH